MSRRKRKLHHPNHERWLVSYADFVTLLFAFFVVLYASSQVDKRKAGQLAAAIQAAFQKMGVFQGSATGAAQSLLPSTPADVAKLMAPPAENAPDNGASKSDLARLKGELETALAAEMQRQEIAMRVDENGLVISLRETGFFESGSAQMKNTSEGTLDRIAAMLREREYRLRIEGYTDNVPIHTSHFQSNWELSTSRSSEIVRLLIVRNNFPPEDLSAAGFAEYHPVASNSTVEGRGMNRRVDIVVLGRRAQEGQSGTDAPKPSASGNKLQLQRVPVAPAPKPAVENPAPDAIPLQQ